MEKVKVLSGEAYFLVKVVSLTITQQSVDCSEGIPLILMSGSAAAVHWILMHFTVTYTVRLLCRVLLTEEYDIHKHYTRWMPQFSLNWFRNTQS